MIIRERPNEFVMIEQDNHAHISGEIMTKWKDSLFPGRKLRKSVEYAIYKHDYGWTPIDKQPFWNDQKQVPFSFMDFPILSKLVFYKYGIDEVEHVDSYAALLCSRHYTRFLLDDTSKEAQAFVQQEEARQKQIIRSLSEFDRKLFDFHYGLLQLCDNLSLYICLNDPGAQKENEHPFFQDGIPLPPSLKVPNLSSIKPYWSDDNTIVMQEFPFDSPVNITLKQKILTKRAILHKGLIESYQETPLQEVQIRLIK